MNVNLYNKKNNKQKGATLLELLLYIGIITVVLSISGTLSMNVLFGKARAAAFEEVSANARISFHLITTKINNAGSIDITLGEASSTIELGMSNSLQDPTVFGVEDGMLWQREGVSEKVFLTTDNVEITDIEFQNVSFTETSYTIRVRMTIESDIIHPRGDQKVSKVFYTTIYKEG